MMVRLPCPVVSETSKVWLQLRCLFHFYGYNLYLIICQTDLNFEHIGHYKLVRFNRVKVMLLLVLKLLLLSSRNVVYLVYSLLLLLLLLPILFLRKYSYISKYCCYCC